MPLDALSARRFYDRIGILQDTQRFYEVPAVRRLVALGDFEHAEAVVELGCGTGRFASNLLENVLPPAATYLALDVSPGMIRLTKQRLAPWADRARVELLNPPVESLPGDDGGFDRFVATYVFDLLTTEDSAVLISEAARLLAPGGLLALVSMTFGTTRGSRFFCSVWNAVAQRRPSLVGGCRPIELSALVSGREWSIRHNEVLVNYAVPSQVLVAERTTATSG